MDPFYKELRNMDQRLSDLEDKMTSIDKKLTQVVDAILGNPLTKSGGFMKELEELRHEVSTLKTRVGRQEDFKKKIIWTMSILGVLFAAVEYLLSVYTKL